MNTEFTEVTLRDVNFKLMTYTNSLKLCARMNYELENIDFIDKIKKGENLFDLGACEGRFSIYAAKKGIHVFSFEPEHKNFSVLSENIKLNNLENTIRAFNVGVGSVDGELTMNIGQPWEGGHQKVIDFGVSRNDLNFDFVDKQIIKVQKLDTIVKELDVVPDYLKIDIDGSEIPFLEGALNTLRHPQLKAIIIELNILDASFDTIEKQLNSLEFKENERFQVPKEPSLFNIIYLK